MTLTHRWTMGLRGSLAPLVLGTATGGALGVAVGCSEARYHGYWANGFFRNAALELQRGSLEWISIGATFGLVYALVSAAAGWAQDREFLVGAHADSRLPHRGAGLTIGVGVLMGFQVAATEWLVATTAGVVVCLYASSFARQRDGRLSQYAGMWARVGARAFPALFACELVQGDLAALPTSREVLAALVLILVLVASSLRVARVGSEPADPLASARWAPGLAAVGFLGVTIFAASSVDGRLTAANPKNVLLVVVDTLRADATTLDRQTLDLEVESTPNLSMLRLDSTVFTAAISQAPWTKPAVASILTGKYPGDHGARSVTAKLRESENSLAELLLEANYQTGAVVSNPVVSTFYGFEQGFQSFDEGLALSPSVFWDITSQQVTDRTIQLLRDVSSRPRPFLLMTHYFDPHANYRDHEAYRQSDNYDGWLKPITNAQTELDLNINSFRLKPKDIEYIRQLYAEEVAFTDAHIGRLLAELDRLGERSNTAVIFVSDHGEEFFERGWFGHTAHLSDELVRVPMLLSLPGIEQVAAVEKPVETRAIFHTLIAYLKLGRYDAPPGASLLAAVRGDEQPSGVTFTEVRRTEQHSAWPSEVALSGVRTLDWKMVYDHIEDTYALYDLATDPYERVDVSVTQHAAFKEIRALLNTWMAKDLPESDDDKVPQMSNPETERLLRSLGYIP